MKKQIEITLDETNTPVIRFRCSDRDGANLQEKTLLSFVKLIQEHGMFLDLRYENEVDFEQFEYSYQIRPKVCKNEIKFKIDSDQLVGIIKSKAEI